jgi:hypothetical protein
MKKEMKTGPISSFKGFNRYTKKSGNSWRKFKNSIKFDMTNTGLIINSRLETRWLHIRKEILKGEGKKINPIRYGPFTILEKSGTNAFRLDLPPYMQIY